MFVCITVNTCSCANGKEEEGLDCDIDGAAECASCDDHYHLAGPEETQACEGLDSSSCFAYCLLFLCAG
jgi:hypothetical protein